jgi:hypothetical protein
MRFVAASLTCTLTLCCCSLTHARMLILMFCCCLTHYTITRFVLSAPIYDHGGLFHMHTAIQVICYLHKYATHSQDCLMSSALPIILLPNNERGDA